MVRASEIGTPPLGASQASRFPDYSRGALIYVSTTWESGSFTVPDDGFLFLSVEATEGRITVTSPNIPNFYACASDWYHTDHVTMFFPVKKGAQFIVKAIASYGSSYPKPINNSVYATLYPYKI